VAILSILVFRSMVDWWMNVLDNELELKLLEPFYNLASNIVCQDIKEYSKKKYCNVHKIPSRLVEVVENVVSPKERPSQFTYGRRSNDFV